MAVVEGGDQADALALEHPVTEHITGHVAYPYYPQGLALRVHPEGTKMPPDRHPRPSGGYPQCLVVVAAAPPGSKGIAQPETSPNAYGIGQVREMGRAFVRRHHQVGVVAVTTGDAVGMDGLPVDDVVRDIKQSLDKSGIGRLSQIQVPWILVAWILVAWIPVAWILMVCVVLAQDETTLGAGRDDERVLFDLRPG